MDIGALGVETGQCDVKPGWTSWCEPREDPGPLQVEKTFGDITVILDANTYGYEDVGLAFRDPDTGPFGGYDGPPLVGAVFGSVAQAELAKQAISSLKTTYKLQMHPMLHETTKKRKKKKELVILRGML